MRLFLFLMVVLIVVSWFLRPRYKQYPLVIGVEVSQGLANQLFQVAMAYCLARRQGKKMLVTRRYKSPHSTVDYFANVFRRVPYDDGFSYASDDVNIFIEPEGECMRFHELPNHRDRDTVFRGLFQSEQYIGEYRNKILQLFEMETERRAKLHQMFPDLSQRYFVHIRRGDFQQSALHNLDLTKYYRNALAYLVSQDPDAQFLVFSNDLDYCERVDYLQELSKSGRVQLVGRNVDEVDTLYAMSLCWKGGIGANSTFSWWGGYLNPNPRRLVIYPKRWLNDDRNRRVDIEIGWSGCMLMDV